VLDDELAGAAARRPGAFWPSTVIVPSQDPGAPPTTTWGRSVMSGAVAPVPVPMAVTPPGGPSRLAPAAPPAELSPAAPGPRVPGARATRSPEPCGMSIRAGGIPPVPPGTGVAVVGPGGPERGHAPSGPAPHWPAPGRPRPAVQGPGEPGTPATPALVSVFAATSSERGPA
jgi:hypothetical protein